MIVRKNREVFLLALRVLARYNEGVHPPAAELEMLRLSAAIDEAGLPVDELCCALICRELCHGNRAPREVPA